MYQYSIRLFVVWRLQHDPLQWCSQVLPVDGRAVLGAHLRFPGFPLPFSGTCCREWLEDGTIGVRSRSTPSRWGRHSILLFAVQLPLHGRFLARVWSTVSYACRNCVCDLRQLHLIPKPYFTNYDTPSFWVRHALKPESHVPQMRFCRLLHTGLSIQCRGCRKRLPRRGGPGSPRAVPLDVLGAEEAHGSRRVMLCLHRAFCASETNSNELHT